MSNLILCFSEISKIFICVGVRHVTFLSEDWKKCPLYGFHFRNAWKGSL